MSDDHEENGSGGEEDDRHERRKSWNPFSGRARRNSRVLERKDVTEGLRRQKVSRVPLFFFVRLGGCLTRFTGRGGQEERRENSLHSRT